MLIKINPLNSPLLNFRIEYKTIMPEITQNKKSSIYVAKSFVFTDFLNIRKISNTKPIKNPFNIKIKKI